jgi:hypothetical protein
MSRRERLSDAHTPARACMRAQQPTPRHRPNDTSRPNITRLLLEGDGTFLDCLSIIRDSGHRATERRCI